MAFPLKDITGFAAALRRGETTCEATALAYLARMVEHQPRLQAFRRVRATEAVAEARALDAELAAGRDRGVLMGVPIAVKEIFAVEGVGCSVNSDVAVADLLPAQGPFVRSLREAGCVILGTTTSTEFAISTINSEKPTPWNPWDMGTRRVCGGSSHGSAVAMAARLCAFAVGSDTGGSVRLPAALCGVTGYKSTVGMWSTDGVFPASPTFDSVGIFTASAADSATVARALDPGFETSSITLRGLRFGLLQGVFSEDLDEPVKRALDVAVRRLREAGAEVSPVEAPEAAEVGSVFSRLLPAEFARVLGRERVVTGRGAMDPVTAARGTAEVDMSDGELAALRDRTEALRGIAASRMVGFDAWLSATSPIHPGPADQLRTLDQALAWNRRAGRNTRPANLFGQCGISLPIASPTTIPAGLQIICGGGQDARLLAIARAVEKSLGLPGPAI